MDYNQPNSPHDHYSREHLRLEGVTTCVGFDDVLDETLTHNHAHFDTLIVVTKHSDRATQKVCQKHGAICVQTDLFGKNGRHFNKGAAVNAGFDHFQYHGWRVHLDSDIVLPDNFRRLLFNHTHLDQSCIYGLDRMDVVGIDRLRSILHGDPQHQSGCLLHVNQEPICHRYIDKLRGYCPIGFFQLWHARTQKPYPYSLGTAQHDDVMFSATWPEAQRRHLATAVCYHLVARPPVIGENWDGHRRQPRLKQNREAA
jgi:hypothetical protein